jgi:hypothetical protein
MLVVFEPAIVEPGFASVVGFIPQAPIVVAILIREPVRNWLEASLYREDAKSEDSRKKKHDHSFHCPVPLSVRRSWEMIGINVRLRNDAALLLA